MKLFSASLLSFLSGSCLVNGLDDSDLADCGVYPDPHFVTFHNTYYDFHGSCDTVLIKSAFLNVHLRTTVKGGWAGIDDVAIGIEGDSLEIQAPDTDGDAAVVLYNGVVATTPPATVGGGSVSYAFTASGSLGSESYEIDLLGGQYVLVNMTYANTWQVTVRAHGSDFSDAEGMCGNWAASAPNNRVGRDGTTVYTDGTAYGEEWKTLASESLFTTVGASTCTYDGGWCNGERCDCDGQGETCCTMEDPNCNPDGVGDVRRGLVVGPCDAITVPGAKGNCEFDYFTTGDPAVASAIAYTDPITGSTPDQCMEASGTACADAGGTCVYRCDTTKYDCNVDLCSSSMAGVVGDADCACRTQQGNDCPQLVNILARIFGTWIVRIASALGFCG